MEMTSSILAWTHSLLRPVSRLIGRLGLARIARQPFGHVVVEILLRPEHAGEGLALNPAQILVDHLLLNLAIEDVRLRFAQREDAVEIGERVLLGLTGIEAGAG